jgi:hypothetical protein
MDTAHRRKEFFKFIGRQFIASDLGVGEVDMVIY